MKKISELALRQIGELARVSAMITNETENDVFFEYSGHCNLVSIRVFKGGWEKEANERKVDYTKDLHLNIRMNHEEWYENSIEEALQQEIENLKENYYNKA